jgi:hypothetical protein
MSTTAGTIQIRPHLGADVRAGALGGLASAAESLHRAASDYEISDGREGREEYEDAVLEMRTWLQFVEIVGDELTGPPPRLSVPRTLGAYVVESARYVADGVRDDLNQATNVSRNEQTPAVALAALVERIADLEGLIEDCRAGTEVTA